MANAAHDANRVPTLIGLLDSDGTTIVKVTADGTGHFLNVSDGITGSDLSGDVAAHDDNRVPTLLAVSSADGITPVPVYVDVSGNLLVDSF